MNLPFKSKVIRFSNYYRKYGILFVLVLLMFSCDNLFRESVSSERFVERLLINYRSIIETYQFKNNQDLTSIESDDWVSIFNIDSHMNQQLSKNFYNYPYYDWTADQLFSPSSLQYKTYKLDNKWYFKLRCIVDENIGNLHISNGIKNGEMLYDSKTREFKTLKPFDRLYYELSD